MMFCLVFFFNLKQGCKMKQLCLHSLTTKICLLILSSSCYTFPCTFVIGICCQVKIITFSLLFSWILYGCFREKLHVNHI